MPVSAETISPAMMGESARLFETEFLQHAASAVFYYFKVELARHQIRSEEFKGAFEKVLKGFALKPTAKHAENSRGSVLDTDLLQLALDSGTACELIFFPRLRDQFRHVSALAQSPRMLRFRRLRGCVKRLAGAQRWSPRCEHLKTQILDYLRGCLHVEMRHSETALLVEA